MVDEILIDDMTEEEWYDSAENEPTEECERCQCEFSASFEGVLCPSCVDADIQEAEWAREFTGQKGDSEC